MQSMFFSRTEMGAAAAPAEARPLSPTDRMGLIRALAKKLRLYSDAGRALGIAGDALAKVEAIDWSDSNSDAAIAFEDLYAATRQRYQVVLGKWKKLPKTTTLIDEQLALEIAMVFVQCNSTFQALDQLSRPTEGTSLLIWWYENLQQGMGKIGGAVVDLLKGIMEAVVTPVVKSAEGVGWALVTVAIPVAIAVGLVVFALGRQPAYGPER